MRGLGKSMADFLLFEKVRYSDERSTKIESLFQEQKYLEEEIGKTIALQISPKTESLHGLGRQYRHQNYKGLYGILQVFQGVKTDRGGLFESRLTLTQR